MSTPTIREKGPELEEFLDGGDTDVIVQNETPCCDWHATGGENSLDCREGTFFGELCEEEEYDIPFLE